MSNKIPSPVPSLCDQDKQQIQEWITAAHHSLADASRTNISVGTRISAALDVIVFSSVAVCLATGSNTESKLDDTRNVTETAIRAIGHSETEAARLATLYDWRNRRYDIAESPDIQDIVGTIDSARIFLEAVSIWLRAQGIEFPWLEPRE